MIKIVPIVRDFRPDMSDAERLMYAYRCLVFSVIPIFYASWKVGYVRLENLDTVGGHPTAPIPPSMETFKVYQRILQNTVEQTIMHVIAVLALVSILEVDQLWNIPLLVFLFVVGRAAFFIGYVMNPLCRPFGFGLTVMPTICSLAYCFVAITLQALE